MQMIRRMLAALLFLFLGLGAEVWAETPAPSAAVARWNALMLRSFFLKGDVVPLRGGSTSGGVTVGGTNVFTGSNTFTDSQFFLIDDAAPTKTAQFQLSGLPAGTPRTFAFPNFSGVQTFITTGAATTVQLIQSSVQTVMAAAGDGIYIGGFTGGQNAILGSSTQTPDTVLLATGTTSNSFTVADAGKFNTDLSNGSCGTTACANPQVTWMSQAGGTQYNSQAYWGNAGRATKALTESAATSAFSVTVASGAGTGGTVTFTAFASDATDQQTLTGVLQFSMVNKAGAETCTTPTLVGTALNSSPVGTLTCTYTGADGGTNACFVQFNCVSSLTQTTLDLYYRVNLTGPGQVIPQ
jgi:hypothetical protein